MKDQSNPLRQIGAFFGLWCFWGTQPEVLNPKQYVIVDTETFEYILSVPEKFEESINKKFGIRTDGFSNRERLQVPVQSQLNRKFIERHRVHLDPNLFGTKPTSSSSLSVISPSRNSSPLSTISSSSSSSLPSKPIVDACKPSDSLIQVLSNLVRSDAFLIEPEPTALRHPHLPSNNLAPENPTVAPVIPIQPPQPVVSKKPRKRNHLGELILSAKEELDRSALEMDRWDLSQLDQIRSNYLNSKSSFSILSSESSSNCESRKDKGRNHSSNQLRFDPLTDSIIGEAIGMTRRVIQKTGPGLDHLLFPKSPSACSSPSSMNLDNTTYRAGQDNRQTFGSKNALYLVEGSQNLDDVNNSISELQKL
ncbi:hypothetical protein BY996DRAFT_8501998 [Phakopsora pachyrhizi]|nr:hypothetical protein BY996DRAFT_8501998 [Phakopsora pachyrhizi]